MVIGQLVNWIIIYPLFRPAIYECFFKGISKMIGTLGRCISPYAKLVYGKWWGLFKHFVLVKYDVCTRIHERMWLTDWGDGVLQDTTPKMSASCR